MKVGLESMVVALRERTLEYSVFAERTLVHRSSESSFDFLANKSQLKSHSARC